jgi:KaiC/GvpD/RAD55 family RecA-like ATPase
MSPTQQKTREEGENAKDRVPSELYQFFSGVGKTLLVKGNPGVGKTIFSLTLLKEIGERENGIYVSTRVDVEGLYNQFPWLKEVIMEHNIIDTAQNALPEGDILELLYKKVVDIDMDYPMVVIDSFGAITSADEDKRLGQEIASFARRSAAQVVLVVEYVEIKSLDYLVDGIVTLKNVRIHGEAHFGDVWRGGLETKDSREIAIEKLRGTPIKQKNYAYSLYQGRFQYFEPFLPKPLELARTSIRDPADFLISSGNKDFDMILNGGFNKGSFNLFEVEHGVDQRYAHLIASILSNAVLEDKRLILFGIGGKDIAKFQKKLLEAHSSKDVWLIKKCDSNTDDNVIPFTGNIYEAIEKIHELRIKSKKEFVYILGLDLFEYYMGQKDTIKFVTEFTEGVLGSNDVFVGIVKRPQQIIDVISHIADMHFVFKDINGSLGMYGMRPKTVIYNIALKERDELIFTPVM